MATTEPGAQELASAFAKVATILADAATVEELLSLTVSLAVTTIDACDLAGVMTRKDGRAVTIAASEQLVRELDQLQIDAGEGPCLDVLAGATTEYVADLDSDDRWPRFSVEAVAAGLRCVLAVHLGAQDSSDVLNLYARVPHAYGPTDRAQGAIFASHAGVALTQRRQHVDDASAAEQLRAALTTREVIGQAQGILMERDRISAPQAFDILRRASQHLNTKLKVIAQELVDTGEDPDTGPSS